MTAALHLLRTAAEALRDELAPAIAGVVAGRRMPAGAGQAATPSEQEDRAGTRLTLAFLEHERRTGEVRALLARSDEPWGRSRVETALKAAMSAPAFLRMAAEAAGPLTAGVLPRVVEVLATEIAEQERRDFDRWLFEQQSALQERLARENRALQVELASYQRESLLHSVEAGKLLENWPLTLVPSQLLQDGGTARPPLRIVLSPPTLAFDRFGDADSGPGDLEGPITEMLRRFLLTHYPAGGERPADFLAGVWDSKRFRGEASIRALFGALRSEPMLVLESEPAGGTLSLRVAYWGLGQTAPITATLVSRLPYDEILLDSALKRARAWRETRDRLLALGRSEADVERLGGERAVNSRLLADAEELERSGIDVRELELPYRTGAEDVAALAQVLALVHCLAAGWLVDVYHLLDGDAPPRLPALLNAMEERARDPAVVAALVAAYETVYAALGEERPAWLPGALLDLAASFGRIEDGAHARRLGEWALGAWLSGRAASSATADPLEAIDPLLRPEDRPFVGHLARHYGALGDAVARARVERFLRRLPVLEFAFASCTGEAGGVTFSADGRTLIDATNDGTILVWDLLSGVRRAGLTAAAPPSHRLTLSGDGRTLVCRVLGADRLLQVWNPANGTLRSTIDTGRFGYRGHFLPLVPFVVDPVQCPPLSADGRTLLLPDEEKVLCLDLESGGLRHRLEGDAGSILIAMFSHDGRDVIGAGQNGTIIVWDAISGARRHVLSGHEGAVRSLAVMPDRQTLVSGSDDGTVRLWDLATGTVQRTLGGHGGEVRTVLAGGDGRSLVAFVLHGDIVVWDVSSATVRHRLPDRGSLGRGVIRPDGRTLLVGSGDVAVWDLLTGELRATVRTALPDQGHVTVLSPDGSTFATFPVTVLNPDADRTIRIWRLPPESEG